MQQESKTKVSQTLQQKLKNLLPSPQESSTGGRNTEDIDASKGTVRVFAYGSLKTGLGNNALMMEVNAKCIGLDTITGQFTMMSFGGFPGVVHSSGAERRIFGEVWSMDTEGLAALDLLEGHPSWYERFKYRTDLLSSRAWMYTLPSTGGYLGPRYPLVPEGIWRPSTRELTFFNAQEGIELAHARSL